MCCNVLGIPALILGIVGLTKQSTDPAGAAKLARYGWIAFAVSVAIAVIGVVIFMAIGMSGGFDGGSSSEFEGY